MLDLIKKAIGKSPNNLMLCEVTSVDEPNATCNCSPTGEEAELLDVSLRAVNDESQTGFICYPKVGSLVLVIITDPTNCSAVVLACAEIEKISIVIGATKMVIKDGRIFLNADAETGEHAVLGDTLKTDLGSMNDRTDRIYSLLTNPAFVLTIIASVADGSASYNALVNTALNTAPPRPALNILSQVIQLK